MAEQAEVEVNNARTGERQVFPVSGTTVRVGRDDGNDVVIASPHVSPNHLDISIKPGGTTVTNRGNNPCMIDGEACARGFSVRVPRAAEIRIAEYSLRIRKPAETPESDGSRDVVNRVVARVHRALITRMEIADSEADAELDRRRRVLAAVKELVDQDLEASTSEEVEAVAGSGLKSRFVDRVAGVQPASTCRVGAYESELSDRLERLANVLRAIPHGNPFSQLETDGRIHLKRLTRELSKQSMRYLFRTTVLEEIEDLVFGFGPLEPFLRHPDLTEIMVVGPERIYVERGGVLEITGRRFISEEVLMDVIERMVAPLGRRVDRSSPMVDGRLSTGYRINAVIAPVAVNGPHLTIRKFPDRPMTMDDLIAKESLDGRSASFLQACVVGRKNLLVAGGTGSGKTTLLNALSASIPNSERIVTIEDSAELRLLQEHVATLEARPPNIEGAGEVTIRGLVRNALRMRPDRIVVGECRGAEAVDMLQAMNTGHAGSMSTLHANSPAEAVKRLEVMVLSALDLPIQSIREQIASAVDVIVHIERGADGRRRVCAVGDVVGFDRETDQVLMSDVFTLDRDGLVPTGHLPRFMADLVDRKLVRVEEFLQS